jgi:hypothetical protein
MRCETCRGTGWIRDPNPPFWIERVCPACQGSGGASCCEGAVGGPNEATNGCDLKAMLPIPTAARRSPTACRSAASVEGAAGAQSAGSAPATFSEETGE